MVYHQTNLDNTHVVRAYTLLCVLKFFLTLIYCQKDAILNQKSSHDHTNLSCLFRELIVVQNRLESQTYSADIFIGDRLLKPCTKIPRGYIWPQGRNSRKTFAKSQHRTILMSLVNNESTQKNQNSHEIKFHDPSHNIKPRNKQASWKWTR